MRQITACSGGCCLRVQALDRFVLEVNQNNVPLSFSAEEFQLGQISENELVIHMFSMYFNVMLCIV